MRVGKEFLLYKIFVNVLDVATKSIQSYRGDLSDYFFAHIQDHYGVEKLRQVSQKSNFINRYILLPFFFLF